MWEKKGNFKDITEVVQHNTGMLSDDFLNPQSDPFIKNLNEAVNLTKALISRGLHIAIVADYDVDGIIAAFNLYEGLEEHIKQMKFTNRITVRFPRRMSEGYGLSSKWYRCFNSDSTGKEKGHSCNHHRSPFML